MNTPAADAAYLARELRTHQAELESQNEELRRAQLELATARDRFQDLFEVAPVGYLSLDEAGCIVEINLTGASLLGQPRQLLLGQPFAGVLHRSERRRWRNHLAGLAAGAGRGRIEMTLAEEDEGSRFVQLETLRLARPESAGTLRLTLTDITERRAADTDRRIAAHLVEAREAERQRVAQALHEDLGQRLSAIKMAISHAARGGAVRAVQAGSVAQAEEALDSLDAAIAVVRQLANELRPAILDDLGLNAAMRWLAQEAGNRLGLQVRLHAAPGDPRVDPRSAIGLYRLLENLLGDVARDAPGAQVDIELHEVRHELRLWLRAHPGGWPVASLPAPQPGARRAGAAARAAALDRLPKLLAELRPLGGRLLEAGTDGGAYRVHLVIPRLGSPVRRPRPRGPSR